MMQRTLMIDPVTLAVLKGRLEQIADEMDATLFRVLKMYEKHTQENAINFSATRVMWIWKLSSTNGNVFTTSTDLTVPSTEKHLTKL